MKYPQTDSIHKDITSEHPTSIFLNFASIQQRSLDFYSKLYQLYVNCDSSNSPIKKA